MDIYHNGRPLSTRDIDNDATASSCSNNYYQTAWWYGACWMGSFWGGGIVAYEDAPYWASTSDYFNYSSIWMR